MKKTVTFLFLMCCAIIPSIAQTANIEVTYDWNHYDRSGNKILLKMTLLVGQEMSKFCYLPGEYVDSLKATPSGLKEYNDLSIKYFQAGKLNLLPKAKTCLCVIKNIAESTVSVYDGTDSNSSYRFKYSEPLENQSWSIQNDSTKNILGYECFMATTSWRGRNWKVWFSPEIPVDNGPWKLCGLPGLILSAEDSTKQHQFIANKIMNYNKEIPQKYGSNLYEESDRMEMLRALRKYYEDPIGIANSANGGVFTGYHSSPLSQKFDFLETDY